MSNTQLLQWLQSANGRIPSNAINQTAKSVWQTVSAPLKALFAIGEDPNSPPSAVFLADAFRPTADGASSTVALRRGLALRLDGSIGDAWDGDVKPMYADTDQVVAFSQNTDASGDDRIDLVVCRPDVEEEEPQTVHHKDTLEGPVYTKTVNTRRNLGFELDVLEGTVDAAPNAPSTPSGWVAICEVTRPNGQAAVLAGDVADVRQREHTFLERLSVATHVWLGEPGGSRTKLKQDATDERLDLRDENGDPAALDIGQLYNATEAFGRFTYDDVEGDGSMTADATRGLELGPVAPDGSFIYYIEFDDPDQFATKDHVVVVATISSALLNIVCANAEIIDSGTAYGGAGGPVVMVRFRKADGTTQALETDDEVNIYVRGL